MRDLVGGSLDGVAMGSRTFTFAPGPLVPQGSHSWDIGTTGSTTALALAVLPLLACRGQGVQVEVRGGVFQDFAPSAFHLQHVLLTLLARMGVRAGLAMVRPGYVPSGGGVIRLSVEPAPNVLHPLVLPTPGPLRGMWALLLLASCRKARVGADGERARAVVAEAGFSVAIEERSDETAAQPSAALAIFVDFDAGVRLSADAAAPAGRGHRHGRCPATAP